MGITENKIKELVDQICTEACHIRCRSVNVCGDLQPHPLEPFVNTLMSTLCEDLQRIRAWLHDHIYRGIPQVNPEDDGSDIAESQQPLTAYQQKQYDNFVDLLQIPLEPYDEEVGNAIDE